MLSILKLKNIILILLACFFLCFITENSYAEFDTNISIGYSGVGIAMILVDYFGGANGEFAQTAGEYGLLTGEFALGFDLHNSMLGIRIEGLFGYYKYSVFEIPNTSYAILLAGAEPYFKAGNFLFGIGGGVFWGLNWQEVFGSQVSPYRSHQGYAAWITLGHKEEESPLEINIRVRWHHFMDYNIEEGEEEEDTEKLTDDFVFILRFCFVINLI